VLVGGQPEPLRDLSGRALVLALIPPVCRCVPDLRRLVARAVSAGASIYLLGTKALQLYTLSKQVGLSTSHAVADYQNKLPLSYHPHALGGVLVRAGTVVRITLDPVRDRGFLAALQSLAGTATSRPAPASTKVLPRHSRAVPVPATLDAITR
jgi:hypothetical protein